MQPSLRTTAVLAAAVSGCAESHHAVVPPLRTATPVIARLAVGVDPTVTVGGYWSHTPLGPELARALRYELSAALARAGYRRHVRPGDLVAKLSIDVSGSTSGLVSTTTLDLLHRGRLVDRFELHSPDGGRHLRAELFPEYTAVRLVNALSASPDVVRVAEEPDRESEDDAAIVAAFDVLDSGDELDRTARDQLSEYVVVRMTQRLGYRVLPRAQLRERLLDEKNGSYRSCMDQACQIELGKALAAQKVLATKLIRLGAACALTATLFDLRTETAESAASVRTACGKEALLQGADDLIDALSGEVDPKPPS
jgi:hypothetical protein